MCFKAYFIEFFNILTQKVIFSTHFDTKKPTHLTFDYFLNHKTLTMSLRLK